VSKHISIVGIGMDGSDTLTSEALRIVENSHVLIGASRMLDCFKKLEKPRFISYKSSDIAEFIHSCEYEKITVLMSGDCGFYSGAEQLLPLIGDLETEVVCGISTPVYFASKLKIAWQNMKFVTLHGVEGNIVRHVCANKLTFFLLGGAITPKDICMRLCEYGLGELTVHIGEKLGGKDERITTGTANELTEFDSDRLCSVIVRNENYEKSLRSCIPDSEFIRGKVPMTKSEVRCVCVSKLEIASDSICWDIGCGTGSVTVEMAVRCPDGRVYAVERNDEAVGLTSENRLKFGCDNIEIIAGNAESTIKTLPSPDCVFIGGSGGFLSKIISVAVEKNPLVKIVATAVSLETLNECVEIFSRIGAETEIIQLAVTRTKRIGSHTMLSAENPVFIIRGSLK
jgi:precorrin-6Y C5,15-methyltransferase (decarboxylating), cbiT subunit